MKFRTLMAAGALLALTALTGCGAVQELLGDATPAQANTVKAAEALVTAADKALTPAVKAHAISVAEAEKLGAIDNLVHKALVDVRGAVERGDSAAVPALLDAFNAINSTFLTELDKDGIAVAIPSTTGGDS